MSRTYSGGSVLGLAGILPKRAGHEDRVPPAPRRKRPARPSRGHRPRGRSRPSSSICREASRWGAPIASLEEGRLRIGEPAAWARWPPRVGPASSISTWELYLDSIRRRRSEHPTAIAQAEIGAAGLQSCRMAASTGARQPPLARSRDESRSLASSENAADLRALRERRPSSMARQDRLPGSRSCDQRMAIWAMATHFMRGIYLYCAALMN